MNFYQVWQTDRQTDWKRCIWDHRGICTGGLKNVHLLLMGKVILIFWWNQKHSVRKHSWLNGHWPEIWFCDKATKGARITYLYHTYETCFIARCVRDIPSQTQGHETRLKAKMKMCSMAPTVAFKNKRLIWEAMRVHFCGLIYWLTWCTHNSSKVYIKTLSGDM